MHVVLHPGRVLHIRQSGFGGQYNTIWNGYLKHAQEDAAAVFS